MKLKTKKIIAKTFLGTVVTWIIGAVLFVFTTPGLEDFRNYLIMVSIGILFVLSVLWSIDVLLYKGD
jgi:hypothetical protein